MAAKFCWFAAGGYEPGDGDTPPELEIKVDTASIAGIDPERVHVATER